MSTFQAILVGIMAGILATGIRIVWVVWNTRLTTFGDYLVAFLHWNYTRKERRSAR